MKVSQVEEVLEKLLEEGRTEGTFRLDLKYNAVLGGWLDPDTSLPVKKKLCPFFHFIAFSFLSIPS